MVNVVIRLAAVKHNKTSFLCGLWVVAHALSLAFSISTASAQNHAKVSPLMLPPQIPPDSCTMSVLGSLSNFKGSGSYVRLRYQLAAIDIAESGLSEFDDLQAANEKKQSPVEVLAGFLVEADALEDHFRCAAYIMGRWRPSSKDERNIAGLSIYSYNQIAISVGKRMKIAKRQFEQSALGNGRPPLMRDAEQTADVDKKTKEAQSLLIQSTGYSLLMAVDLTEAGATSTPYMTLSCGERDSILAISKTEGDSGDSDYQKAASLIFKSVSDHKCRS